MGLKIAVRAGHNFSVPGVCGFIDETIESRNIKDEILKNLIILGYEVLDVTSLDTYNTISSDLCYGVNRANEWEADMFISIHFSTAYQYYNGSIGSEVCVYDVFDEAERVANLLGNLGFKNRGLKIRKELYELKHTYMKAMIIKVCFVEASLDVEKYNSLGGEKIGEHIAKAIAKKDENISDNKDCECSQWIIRLQEEINNQGFKEIYITGILDDETLLSCPIVAYGARGNITKLIQERLNVLGFNTNGIDGYFGDMTLKSVMEFQRIHGLLPDGKVGQNTWKLLLE